ncbi:hypothetical protein [Polyangium jinanense]|uniref:Uncharacterized protein n=1 Tax=Polyangium jinanense TaxID=2829994 RepID=A0A9X3X3C2_9BACT|nr:hypothetical protein [Polyangium jinanense]MDC3954029.1 hypothetical protein [Polyangium jinanense]MDC3982015.1 hypothetical protein [Polyangium jinanense]
MVTREQDPFSHLAALAHATEDLRPTDELTEAVLLAIEPPNERLARIARETSDLAPSEDFASSVMAKVGAGRGARPAEPPWSSGVVRFGRFALIGAAAAAVLGLWLSRTAETGYDSAVLESVASVEVYE